MACVARLGRLSHRPHPPPSQIVEFVNEWVARKAPAIEDGVYRSYGVEQMEEGPVRSWLKDVIRAHDGAYPKGISLEIKGGEVVRIWGSI